MKVYTADQTFTDENPWSHDTGFKNGRFNYSLYLEKIEEYNKKLKKYSIENLGYGGKNTGIIYRIPVADGHAEYMLLEPTKGRGTCLILLAHSEYESPWAAKATKKEIIDQHTRRGAFKKMAQRKRNASS